MMFSFQFEIERIAIRRKYLQLYDFWIDLIFVLLKVRKGVYRYVKDIITSACIFFNKELRWIHSYKAYENLYYSYLGILSTFPNKSN